MSREHFRSPMHGRDHAPRGSDPAYTERWHKCGDPGEPALGAGLTGFCWFRLAVGPWDHSQQSLEVVIAVDGGGDGDTVATLPAGYFGFADGQNIPAPGFDASGGFRAYYVDGTSGDIVIGPLP